MPPRIPLWLKLTYSAFVAVLVPTYLRDYGPTNFLYFCDVAILMVAVGVWTEKSIWISMAAVGDLAFDGIWIVDLIATIIGRPLTGMTAYMFNPNLPLYTRGLSLFHIWLPLLLLWLLHKLGYDRRAFWAWTMLAWLLMLIAFFFMPAPPAPADNPNLPVNINYVYGLSDEKPQEWMPANLYFALLMVALPTVIF